MDFICIGWSLSIQGMDGNETTCNGKELKHKERYLLFFTTLFLVGVFLYRLLFWFAAETVANGELPNDPEGFIDNVSAHLRGAFLAVFKDDWDFTDAEAFHPEKGVRVPAFVKRFFLKFIFGMAGGAPLKSGFLQA